MKKFLLTAILATTASFSIASDEVKIGAVLPFSGGLEIFGEQAKAGIDLAVAEVNAAGGVQGRPLKVIYEDNKTDPKTSVEKANKLIRREKVISLIGPITSSARDAMIPTVKRFKTPLLYATNYEGGLCEDNVFSFNSVPNQELEKLIPAMAIRSGKSFYLFGTDYIWPQKMFERAETEIAKIGGKVVAKTFTPWGVKDYTPVIRKIMNSGADVLVLAVPGVDGTTFIKQANELGLPEKVSFAFLGFSETYLNAFGDNNQADMWVAVPFISTMESNKDFVSKVKANNPEIGGVSHYAKTHYNAVKAIVAAINHQSKALIDSKSVLAGLKNLKTDDIEINSDNQANLDMFIGHVNKGQLEMVIPLGKQIGEVGCKVK